MQESFSPQREHQRQEETPRIWRDWQGIKFGWCMNLPGMSEQELIDIVTYMTEIYSNFWRLKEKKSKVLLKG